MALPNEKLAASLEILMKLQEGGRRVFQSSELTRVHRERLVRTGFLYEVVKGWLISSRPTDRPGDSTAWFASFWEFCAGYCDVRFGKSWYVSAELSIFLQTGQTVVPKLVVVNAIGATNQLLQLPHDTSLMLINAKTIPEDIIEIDGMQMFSLAAALVKVPEDFYTRFPLEAQIALMQIKSSSEILAPLLEGGHTVVAGRLAGAFRRLKKEKVADEIVATMRRLDFDVRERDPFDIAEGVSAASQEKTPTSLRVQMLWRKYREVILHTFPESPGLPADVDTYIEAVDEIFTTDAYHSLSIEGYQVTLELIERIKDGIWDPDNNEEDENNRNALAALGYWKAFQEIKEAVRKVIVGEDAAMIARDQHQDWFQSLFQPAVEAGLIGIRDLSGYRNNAVYLRGSRYVPPQFKVVLDAMQTLFELLEDEPEASVRAVLGHFFFGYIHPYFDGNGRLARFLMNVMLASGGYPWTVIKVDDRKTYLSAMETASVDNNIEPFAKFIAGEVRKAMS